MMFSQLTLFTTIVWVSINLDLFTTCSAQNTYYVSATTASACPSEPCFNFSHYIQNSETYFTSNTTFIFSPGDHIVEGNVSIANVSALKLIGSNFPDGRKTQIMCSSPAGFEFKNVSQAKFIELKFISCGIEDSLIPAIFLSMTDNFEFTNCTFQHGRNTALLAFNSTVVLTGSKFTNNSASQFGGGILALWSRFYLQGENTFAHNSAMKGGGAIAVIKLSTLITTGSTVFINNTAANGGGIVVALSTATFMGDSYFLDNVAVYGSMIYIENGSALFSANQTFHKNSAFLTGGIFLKYAQIDLHGQNDFVNNTCTYQYGGSSVISGLECALNITGNTNFISNSVPFYAGAISVTYCNLSFKGSNFFHNNSGFSSGVISISNSSAIFEGNTLFTNNHAQHLSGAINTAFSSVKFLGSVSFVGNIATRSGSGAIFATYATIVFGGNSTFMSNLGKLGAAVSIFDAIAIFNEKASFHSNTAEFQGGAVYMANSQSFFLKNFVFSGNHAVREGGAIAAVNSTLTCSGNGTFLNNSAMEGGGLFLELDSKFEFSLTMVIQFSENTAQRGGAIHVTDNVYSIECTNDPVVKFAIHPPQCFFRILNSTNDFYKKPLWFKDNTATEEGSVLYGGRLDKCDLNPPFLNEHGNLSLSIFRTISEFQTDTINTTLISSAPFRVCFCQESEPNCTYQPPDLSTQRGEIFSISIAALDQVNQTIPATIRSYLSTHVGTNTYLRRGDPLQQTDRSCTELHYQAFSQDEYQELILYAEGPCRDVGEGRKSVNLTFRPCPVGFQLSQEECVCDRQLQSFTTECNIEDATVTRTNNFWMSPYYSENDTYIGLILHPHCPFDYCLTGTRNVSPSHSDSLCAHNRSGILCGACQQNFSLALGSSRCLKCENAYLGLIIPLALFGIALVVFLIVLKLTVAIGTINGLIFYANVLAVNRSTFFPSGETNVLTIFIAWLNLDLGIETCFYDGMDTYGRVWLQFVFPAYVWTLVGLIIFASSLSMRLAKIFGTNPVSVLAMLFLLSYGKILRTIITIMSFTILEYPDGSQVTVWLSDGNITYLRSKHIPLFITALIALLFFFLPYTFLLLLGQWLSPLSNVKGFSWLNNTKFKSFMDAYYAPYTAKCRYWTGLLLLVRLGLFLAFAFNALRESSVNLLIISSTTLGLAMWYILVDRVYSNWYLNTLEFSFILNLGILSVATLYIGGTGGSQAAATYLSVSIALTTFLGILFYHIYLQLKGTKAWNRVCLYVQNKDKSTEQTLKTDSGPQTKPVATTFIERPKSTSSGIKTLSNTVELREPLLGD